MNERLVPRKLQPPAPPGVDARAIAERAVLGARPSVDVTLPGTDTAAKMRMLTHAESIAARVETRKFFADLGYPSDPSAVAVAGLQQEWNLELACRCLAIAIRDPRDESKPLAPLDDWRQSCTDDQIAALWVRYGDLAEDQDPMGASVKLTEEDCEAIKAAAGKPEGVSLLTDYGSRKLALFISTSVATPSS